MINLLPLEQKKKLHREYTLRLVLVIVSGFIMTTVIGTVLLLPSFLLSKVKERVVSNQASLLEKKADKETADTPNNILIITKRHLTALSEDVTETSPSLVISTALSHKPNGVIIKQVLLDKTPDGTLLSIGGTAESRGQLTSFSSAIEGDALFTSVEFPVSNLAKDRDIDFTIKVKGDF